MIRQIMAMDTMIIDDLEKSCRSSPKANSATPLAPGVGLTNIKSHNTNCFANSKKCSKTDSLIKA